MPDEGGDAPCWAERVCDACGVLVEPGAAHSCAGVVHLDRQAAGGGSDGVIWALTGERQVDANLVVLGPGGEIGAHENREVDVLIVVLVGSGWLTLDGATRPLATHDLSLIARGAVRQIAAGPTGMRFLSIHRARPGPTIGSPR